jgi:hypothetical protein
MGMATINLGQVWDTKERGVGDVVVDGR